MFLGAMIETMVKMPRFLMKFVYSMNIQLGFRMIFSLNEIRERDEIRQKICEYTKIQKNCYILNELRELRENFRFC